MDFNLRSKHFRYSPYYNIPCVSCGWRKELYKLSHTNWTAPHPPSVPSQSSSSRTLAHMLCAGQSDTMTPWPPMLTREIKALMKVMCVYARNGIWYVKCCGNNLHNQPYIKRRCWNIFSLLIFGYTVWNSFPYNLWQSRWGFMPTLEARQP